VCVCVCVCLFLCVCVCVCTEIRQYVEKRGHQKNAIHTLNARAHMPCSKKCSNLDISQSANQY